MSKHLWTNIFFLETSMDKHNIMNMLAFCEFIALNYLAFT